jgi:hypothetical protein
MIVTNLFIRATSACLFLALSIQLSSCKKDDDEEPLPLVPDVISCNEITTPTIWPDKGLAVDYILDCDLIVSDKLTISPNVTIQCRNNASITITENGAIVAVGSSTSPIVLKGEVETPGYWKGLFIQSNNPQNELSFFTISHGGSASFDGLSDRKANIRLKFGSKLSLTHSTISYSAQEGLFAEGVDTDLENPFLEFSENSFSNNASYPISIIAASVKTLDVTSVYSANGSQFINVRGGRMVGTHQWKPLAIPYRIQGIASVGNYEDFGNLTIEPGVEIRFAGDAGLCTGDYSTGSWMKILGTSANRITLTGTSSLPGAWKGIAFQSTSPENESAFTDISFGGSSSYTGNTNQKANIIAGAWSPGSFNISNSTISNSAAWGVYVNLPSPEISIPPSVTYTNNASGNYFHE